MTKISARLAATLAACALLLAAVGAPLAQTSTTTAVRNFEVLVVDGNRLVVRNPDGTHEYNVPDDFRITVDGKQLAVRDLKPGMKGTATVTTKTTVTPVFVTEVREADVLRAADLSVTIREADGVKRYTQAQLDDRGVQVYKDGKAVRLSELRRGDKLTATIVSKGRPVVLTETEVQATLREGAGTAVAAATTAAAPAAAPAPAAASAPAAAPAAAPATAAPTASSQAAPAAPAQASSGSMVWWVLLLVVAAVLAWMLMRKKGGS